MEPQQCYIRAGVTLGKGDTGFWKAYWKVASWLTGKGRFVHTFLGYEECGREKIYHSTKAGSHVVSRRSFLLNRVVVDEWAIPVLPEVYAAFVDSCTDDSGLVPYGHVQNVSLGAIKFWNGVIEKLSAITGIDLSYLVKHKNPFGAGKRKQNCSERAGRKLADFITGGSFLKKDPDLYAPADFHDELSAYENVNREVRRLT